MAKKNQKKAQEQKSLKFQSLEAGPMIPSAGDLVFLKMAEHYLTPEEIKQAVEEGKKDHQAHMAAKNSEEETKERYADGEDRATSWRK